MNSSSMVEKAVKLAHFIKTAVKLVADIIAQNYAGAVVSAAQILPQLIAIVIFLIIAPIILFMCLPAMLIDNFMNEIIPSNEVTHEFVQDYTTVIYKDYMYQANRYLLELEEDFNGGFIDPVFDYSDYGDRIRLDITRDIEVNGILIDVLWYASLHSVYFGNDPANITLEGTLELLTGIIVYSIIDTVIDIIEATRTTPLILVITRILDIEFIEPYEIMSYFGFDEQQVMWAGFMHSVLSGDYQNYEGD